MNEAMKQAWLEISQMLGEPTREELDVFLRTWQRASQATREALAEQPAQQQCRTDGRCQYAIDSGAEGMGHCPKGKCVMPAQQEPVAFFDSQSKGFYWAKPTKVIPPVTVDVEPLPLYTSPPAQRKPLTDEELDAMFSKTLKGKKLVNWVARAIEAAHGIKENT